jgi:hypothetical protein
MTTRKYSSRSQQTTITSAITSGATTMTVAAASALLGGIAPAAITGGITFTVVIDPDTALEEILDITGASSSTMTITRAVDGSSAQDHSAGAVVRHMLIGRDVREPNTHQETSTGVHGLASTSSVVGTLDTQTLTNKTLTSPTVNTPTIAGATISGAFTSTATITGGTITGATVTGLSAPTSGSDATTKTYVDTILGSAVAAATSATSAATSATSAAASATAAATSATSAAASATLSANSSSSAATQATNAATSATSAAASATAAATSATSAAASATAAATSATSASTQATAAASSATTAAASVATIASYATAASTSANSAATSAASAAASTSAAAASASAAATSAASAVVSATAASTSASSALTSQTAAATSATSAATQATAAATSATSAATQATAAATSATSAAASATAAATSAASSLSTYNTFKTEYLGAKSSAPTLDNVGNALITGASYWNSTSNALYVWSGTTWVQTANTTTYTAPTLGGTTLTSGGSFSNINSLTINSTTIPSSATLAKTADKLSAFATTTSAELAGVISDETGSGSLVFATAPTLTGALVAADPTTSLGIASKQYVDLVTAGVNYHAPVIAASVSNLSANYSNGTSGVGATLTADTNRAFSTLDGQSVSVGQRILIKDQTSQLQNGIYTLTTIGSGSVPWVITRATDNDQTPEIANGDVINVTGGTVNSGKTFVNSSASSITIGTTAITFASYYTGLPAQTGSAGNYLTTDGTTPSWAAVSSYSAPTIGSTSIGSGATVTTIAGLTLTSPTETNPYVTSPKEVTTVSGTAITATQNFDALTQGVLYVTASATSNFTLNFRGSSTVTLNTSMAVGASQTVSLLSTNGSTAYYPSAFQIDGTSVTPKWSGGTAPSAGNASAIDAYQFTIIKTASTPTYTVLAAGPIKYA